MRPSNQFDRLEIIYGQLKRTASRFGKQPFDALYESDLRSHLFAGLLDAFEGQTVDLTDRLPRQSLDMASDYKINIVKTEYPSSIRFDIAFIDSESTHKELWWNQPVSIAIELKYWQADGTGGSFERDLEKLFKYRRPGYDKTLDCGLALLFIQPGGRRHWGEYAPPYCEKCKPCTGVKPGIWLHAIELGTQSDVWQCMEYPFA